MHAIPLSPLVLNKISPSSDAQGLPLKTCGEIGSCIAAKVVEVIGTKIDIPRWRVAKQEIRELMASRTV